MDQLYTLTKNTTQSDVDMLSSAVQAVGRVELSKIDSKNGVKLSTNNIIPNFDISSFSYFPKINNEYGALCCASLRKTLKNKNIRGSKELSHVVLFDSIPDGVYAIDLIRSNHFKNYNDIELDEVASVANGNEDLVCEVKPNEMPQITFDIFSSEGLKIEDITNAGSKTLQRVAEIFHALIVSKCDKKPLYIVYNLEDYKTLLNYLTIALKLMPASVANKFSFVTCLGKTSRVNFDICCIPTCDKEYISTLKSEGNVIIVTGLESMCVNEEKGAFANFLSRCKQSDFKQWLLSLYRYTPYITSIENMDDIAILYNNTLEHEFNSDNPLASLRELNVAMRVVSDKYELITKIDNELDIQLDGISRQLDFTLGAVQRYSIDDIKRYIIEPFFDLFDKCKNNDDIVSKLYGWLKRVLFGDSSQSVELEKKHFEIVSRCFQYIREKLGDNYASFIAYIGQCWDGLSEFFNKYLKEAIYSEASSSVVLSLLSCLLPNLTNTRMFSPDMRDYLAKIYLQNNPDRFDKIVQSVFLSLKTDHYAEFNYIFNKILKYEAEDRIITARIKYLGQYFSECGLLNESMNYVKERFLTQVSEDKIIRETFTVLLSYYIVISRERDFASLCNTFETAKNLVGENPTASLQGFIFGYWNEKIVVPNYINAFRSIRFENISKADVEIYKDTLAYLKSSGLRGIISVDFIKAFEKFINEYNGYIMQKDRERCLLNERINFVAREISLLDNKTILRILNKYIGEDKVSEGLQAENITNIKKDRHISDFAKDETEKYLKDPNSTRRVEFCSEVRAERTANFKDYRIISRDIFNNVVGSSIFTVIMTVVAALLSLIIYNRVVDSYFKNIYFIFVLAIAIFSEIIYWSNYKDRRLRNVLVMSIWQMLLIILATLGVYALIQFVFISIGV
jgi:hypothetical protein